MSTQSRKYVIVSPCRDEEEFAARTIASVVAQEELPALWVIVDDGSSDGTPEILRKAASEHSWIKVVRRTESSKRVLGAGVIRAFDEGCQHAADVEHAFVSKLDMDLELPATYYSALLDEMEKDPRLGSASGRPLVLVNDNWRAERGAVEMSAGMAKFYRIDMLEQIGGLVTAVMWDGIDCHEGRRRGWRSKSFDMSTTDFRHLRDEGASDGSILKGRRRRGRGQYFMGTSVVFMIVSALVRSRDYPVVLGSLHTMYGYFASMVTRQPRYGTAAFRRDLRRFQWESLILGKGRATRRWDRRTSGNWDPSAGGTLVAG